MDAIDINSVINNNSIVLVDVWAPWCSHCMAMMPHVDKLSKDFEQKIKVIKVNASESNDFISKHAVRSLPTFLIFKNGAVVDRFNGSTNAMELNKRITSVL